MTAKDSKSCCVVWASHKCPRHRYVRKRIRPVTSNSKDHDLKIALLISLMKMLRRDYRERSMVR